MAAEPDELQVQPADAQNEKTQVEVGAEEFKLRQIREALEVGKRLKDEGGALFKAGKFEEAVNKYNDADEQIGDTFLKTFTLFDESDSEDDAVQPPYPTECLAARDQTIDLTASCRLNAGICCIKLQRWEEAVNHTSSALKYTGDEAAGDGSGEKTHMLPTHIKALFNRGRAYAAMGKLTDAKSDLAAVAKLDPKNRAAREQLRLVKQRLKARKPKLGFFGGEENDTRSARKNTCGEEGGGNDSAGVSSGSNKRDGAVISKGGSEEASIQSSEASSKKGSAEEKTKDHVLSRDVATESEVGAGADGAAESGAPSAKKTSKAANAGPARKIGTDYGKWEKMEKDAETQEEADRKNEGFVVPRHHLEWMAKEGWLPGTARYKGDKIKHPPQTPEMVSRFSLFSPCLLVHLHCCFKLIAAARRRSKWQS
jgi:tetratricopeptide (TPR) repeat protein